MPKKEKNEEESSELEDEIEGSEIEEIAEEINEDSIDIKDNKEFEQFVQPQTQSFSPVLERIAEEPEARITPIETEDNKREDTSNLIRYSEFEEESKPDYELSRQNEFQGIQPIQKPERIETTEFRRDIGPQLRNMNFVPQEIQEMQREDDDYVVKAERLDTNDNLPFQQKERKYKGRDI